MTTTGPRFPSAATTGLVALITARELSRRRGAIALAALLPLAFFLVRLDTHWTAVRLLSIGLAWATATLALFTQVSSRSIDRRLAVGGAPRRCLVLGRHIAVLALGWGLALAYTALVLATIGHQLANPAAVPVMLVLTATIAAPLGALAASLVPRDLEGALLLLSVMAVQVLVDPAQEWTRALPLWSTRELASHIVDGAAPGAPDPFAQGLAHAGITILVLAAASALLGALRLRTARVPAPH